jgi:hypothetical protein
MLTMTKQRGRPPKSLEERFWSHVLVRGTDDCWPWQGYLTNGYGKLGDVGAHRISYRLAGGVLPPGWQLDHLCHTLDPTCPGGATCPHRRCVNPLHLEPVSNRTNVLRGKTVTAANAAKVECVNGHSLADAYVISGRRVCRPCSLEHSRRWREDHRDYWQKWAQARKVERPPQTHCKRGHEFTEENTLWLNNPRRRQCRECARLRGREFYARKVGP